MTALQQYQQADDSDEGRKILFYAKVDATKILSPTWKRYADHANYLQHRILVGQMLWQVDRTQKFTMLKTAYLRQIIQTRVLKPLLVEMERVGLIKRDGYYIEGGKSYGYRIGNAYANAKTIRIECQSAKLGKRIKTLRRRDYKSLRQTHCHLFKWLQHLNLDPILANQLIDKQIFDDAILPVTEMRELNRLAVRLINDKAFDFKVCDYGRVHTNITRLLKPLRNILMIDGVSMTTIDIANSQPLFLLMAYLNRIPTATPSIYKYSVHNNDSKTSSTLPTTYISTGDASQVQPVQPIPPTLHPTTRSPYTKCKCAEQTDFQGFTTTRILPADVDHFRYLCEAGRLYQYLMERMDWTQGKSAFKSDELFRCLYGRNTVWDGNGNYNPSRLEPIIKTEFPTIWKFIRGWKKANGYKDLARQMQREESRLMIDGVCGRLAKEHPDCPLVTVHDSIMTTSPWVETVKNIILEEFARLGIRPNLHIEPGTVTEECEHHPVETEASL